MLRFLALCAVLATSTLNAQPPSPTYTGTREGISYTYQKEYRDDGHIELTGRYLRTNDPFRLVVAPSGLVTGRVDGNPVKFWVAKKVRDRLFASRELPALDSTAAGSATQISSRR